MKISETLGELAAALANAQAAIQSVKFDSDNKFYGSRYASLNAVIEAIREPMKVNGLSIAQEPFSKEVNDTYFVGVETMLLHKSGEFISEVVSLPVMNLEMLSQFTSRHNRDGDLYFTSPNVLQESGKIITYLRRYGIISILRMSAEEDIDGNSPDQQVEQQVERRVEQGKVTKTQAKAEKSKSKFGKRPYDPDTLVEVLKERAKTCPPASEAQVKLLVRKMQELIDDDDYRHVTNKYLFGAEHISEADPKIVVAAIRWLNLDDQYQIDPLAKQEVQAVINMVLELDEQPD